jgi:hypothetical protein
VWTMQSEQPLLNAAIVVTNGISFYSSRLISLSLSSSLSLFFYLPFNIRVGTITCVGVCAISTETYTFTLTDGIVIPGAISAYTDVGVSEVLFFFPLSLHNKFLKY